ncbi:hypothetical protein wVul_1227 [Wolbachia endosymbiont of Armadillidium vulgare str. wVulC]|uniref:hypothetical protein n=1 Tax=Wolbachia endosymbiont of Armadillidium vulgare TaxID=77039 RepID=UPI00064946C9|nr:hypothetical protein [Wolbachia endosymbiont of Armadillidium vulgare]KLT22293.1 hypothetical protein wVul_1227 [Wolbachia endosymbiont of Armadillidium vulgare str. wVulC]
MPKITQQLIKAFNVDNRYNRIIDTNFTLLENNFRKDEIVIKFDKNMTDKQCMVYLHDLKSKMVERFFPNAEDANVAFNVQSFPFNLAKGDLRHRKGKCKEYVVPIDDGTLFNLKSYLMSSFAQCTIEKLTGIFGEEYMDTSTEGVEFDHERYLYSTDFGNKGVRGKFIELFLKDITTYDGAPCNIFKIEDNEVSIRDIFKGNPRLIESMIERQLWLMGRDLRTSNSKDKYVEEIKDRIISFISVKTGIKIDGIFRAAYLGSEENSLLIPNVLDVDGEPRWLTRREVKNINEAFGHDVLNNVQEFMTERQLKELQRENYKEGIYGINFYDKKISCYVLNKIIESSVINEDKGYKLSIDPARVPKLSPPLDSPLPKTPPQEKEDRDSGIETTPPKPKGSAACSSSDSSPEKDPTSLIKRFSMKRQSPKRKQPESTDISDGVKKNNRDSGVHFLESSGESRSSPDSKLESSTTESRARVPVSERDFSE